MKNTIYFCSLILSSSLIHSIAFAEENPSTAKSEIEVRLKPATTTTSKYSRNLQTVNGETIYVVNSRAPHLYMISRDLYGTDRFWKDIAAWNSIKEPFAVKPGQKLIIKKAPTLSIAESDALLIKTFKSQNRMETAKGIEDQQAPHSEAPRAVAVATEEKEATPVVPASSVPPTPPVPVAAATPTEPPAPTAPATPATPETPEVSKESEQLAQSHSGHWKFKTSAVVSQFKIRSQYKSQAIDYNLSSDIDYGVELEAAYHVNEKSEFILGASLEKMDIHPPSGGELEGEAQYLARYNLGFESKVSEKVALAMSLALEQTPFIEEKAHGPAVEAFFVPQFVFGARWKTYERGGFNAWLLTDAIILGTAKRETIDLQTGGGYHIGFKFSNKLEQKTLTYGLSYRDLKQDSLDVQNSLKTYFANIGLVW